MIRMCIIGEAGVSGETHYWEQSAGDCPLPILILEHHPALR